MPSERTAQPWARWTLAGLLALVVLLVILSPSFGRADPAGRYRPPLPPDALTNGCYPLPDGVTLDFPYQVRSDGDADGHRNLVLQYDQVDQPEALSKITSAFVAAGFTPAPDVAYVAGVDRSTTIGLSKPGVGEVDVEVVALSPLKNDQIVRGTISLTLPVEKVQSTAPVCSDVTSTKRFPSDEASHDQGVPGGIN